MLKFDNVTKVMLIQFCTRFHLYIHIYALYLQRQGLSLLEVGTIESLVITTLFLAEVPTGVFADRIGRKGSVVMWVLLMMCAELLFFFSSSYPMYLLVAVLTGIGFAFGSGATDALVYESLPVENRDEHMKRVMGRIGSVAQLGFFIAPIIGGFIVGDLAPERVRLAIAFTVMALGVAVLISLTLRDPETGDPRSSQTSSLQIFRSGWRQLRQNSDLQRIVLLSVLTAPFGGLLITTFAAPHMTQNEVSPALIGVALSIGSLLAAFTQRWAYRVEQVLGPRLGVMVLTLFPGIMYWGLALLAGPLTWLWIVLMYGTNDMRAPLFSAYQNAHIQPESRATVLSLINMLLNIYIAVMAPLYAAIATGSLPLAFMLIGSVILLAGCALRVRQGEAFMPSV